MAITERHEENITGLHVCVDCAAVIANGDWEQIDDYDKYDIRQGLARTSGGYWVLDCGENEENDIDFSTTPCDCCRRKWAGARHGASILDALFS
jgi:hypothetical protein